MKPAPSPLRPQGLLAFAFVLLAPCAALAQQPDAEEHIRRGIELRRANNDAGALAEFRAAWEASRSPRARAQMGLAEQAVGAWAQGEEHLLEALSFSEDAWIRRSRAALTQALEAGRRNLANLEITSATPGASVVLGNAAPVPLPLARPLRVRAGSVTVSVQAQGFVTAVRTLTVDPGALAREVVDLVAIAPSAPATPEPPVRPELRPGPNTPAPALEVRPPAGGHVDVSPGASSVAPRRIAAGALLAVGGALGIGAGVALAVREGVVSHARSDACIANGLSRGQNCASDFTTADTLSGLAIAGFVVGGAAAATAIVLFATSANRGAPATTRALACAPQLGGVGLSCGARF